MTNRDKTVLIEGLRKLSQDAADIASALEGETAQEQDTPVENTAPESSKAYTYEEVRAILAEKSRTGYRAEVKAILTAHGVRQLSEITDPDELAVVVAEAEVIGNA